MKVRVYIGFILAIVLVLVIGINSYHTFNKQHINAANQKRSYRVLNQLQQIQSLLTDMETGRRGFRSTNDVKFLEPYQNALVKIDTSIAELERLAINPQIQSKLPALQNGITGIITFWKNLDNNADNFDKQDIAVITEKEKTKMDELRSMIIDIELIEKGSLSGIEKENIHSVTNAIRTLIISILLIIMIVLALIFLIVKEFNSRKKAQSELKINNAKLETSHKESQEKNWILEGVMDINNSLHGNDDVRALSQSILDAVISYFKNNAGAFYLLNNETELLEMVARYSLPLNVKTAYKPGEGLVGSAAIQKEIVVISTVPSEYVMIATGQSNLTPAQALYMPIYIGKNLKAVMELFTLTSFEPHHKKVLGVICNNIGIAIESAEANKNVLNLLSQVQEQKEALEQQQEELRQANEELNHQAEVLQHSEEELKVQEEELRQINAELEEKNEAVEIARQSLELKAKELETTGKYKSEFLANMSHELRTPLNSVLILARLLADNKDHNLNDKQISHAKIIHKSGADLLQLINEILDLSKIEAGKIDLHFEYVPVKDIVYDIEQLFRVVAEDRGIHFKASVDDGAPEIIQTDKQRIEQVLKNLLSNAFKFTEANGQILINFCAAKNNSDLLQVTVSDNGIGISPTRQQEIFEAFQQADGATNRKYGGTGLGLSISKELISILGGNIFVESEIGKGSTFIINVPVVKSKKDGDESQAEKAIRPNSFDNSQNIIDDRFNITPGDKVLLVIEDDDNFAKIVRHFGFGHGFKCVLAVNGSDGIMLAKKYKPGAIILDMHLPDMDGATVLQMIKSDHELANIPVHIISAVEDPIVPGAFAYLQKPLSKKDLDNVFLLIGEMMKEGIKKVLLISGATFKNNVLNNLIASRQLDIQCDIAISAEDAFEKTQSVKYDCIIADIGKDVEEGIASLQTLNSNLRGQVPIIIHLDEDITPGDDLQLKKISDVVVRRSSLSPERLMDELELFLYKVQQVAEGKVKASADNVVLGDQSLHGKKALLVDDDMRNIFALTAALEPEHMEIFNASDGKEAVQILTDTKDIDIILMDIMMPNMDGYQAMNYIRKDMAMMSVPIIALTAKAMSDDREKCIAAGASDYISKPVDIQKLKSLMRVWLSQ